MHYIVVGHVTGALEQKDTRILAMLENAEHALHYASNVLSPTFFLATCAASKAEKNKDHPVHNLRATLASIHNGHGRVMVLPIQSTLRIGQ